MSILEGTRDLPDTRDQVLDAEDTCTFRVWSNGVRSQVGVVCLRDGYPGWIFVVAPREDASICALSEVLPLERLRQTLGMKRAVMLGVLHRDIRNRTLLPARLDLAAFETLLLLSHAINLRKESS